MRSILTTRHAASLTAIAIGSASFGQSAVLRVGSSGNLPSSDIVGPSNLAAKVEAGGRHAIVLRSDGRVECFGSNLYGQCSVPAPLTDGSTRAVAVSASGGDGGFGISAALSDEAEVFCWGNNLVSGQTDIPAEASDAKNPVIAISAGGGQEWGHMLALRQDLTLIAWGSLETSDVPASIQGHVAKIASGVLHGCCILTDGTVTVFGPMQDSLHQVPFAARDPAFPVTQLSIGRSSYTSYAVALRSDGVVVCWGDGPVSGPSPDPGRPFVRVAARVGGGVALRSDGSIAGWGTSQLSSFPACMGTVHFPVREFAYGAGGLAVALVPATDCNLDGAADACPPASTLQYTVDDTGAANFQSIQEAIDAVPCHGRAVITVGSGTYFGTGAAVFEVNQKSITVRADTGATVVIDGQNARRCAILRGSAHEVVLAGLRLTRGSGPASGSGSEWQFGGGVLSTGTLTPAFTDCVFNACSASNGGAVALGVGSSSSARPPREATFLNCVVQSNSARPPSGSGGGIFATNLATSVRASNFAGNSSYGWGGAAYLEGGIVEDCAFTGNQSSFDAANSDGGALFVARRNGYLGNGTIRRTRFEANSAVRNGGVTFQWGSASNPSLIEDCDFVGNFTSPSAASQGGALSHSGHLTLRRCDFIGNQSPLGSSIRGSSSPTAFILEDCSFTECCQVSPPNGFVDGGGNDYEPTCPDCAADVDCDGVVGPADLSALLATFGTSSALMDLNGDGQVDGPDLTILLATWGACPK